jgi:hypothetical protein
LLYGVAIEDGHGARDTGADGADSSVGLSVDGIDNGTVAEELGFGFHDGMNFYADGGLVAWILHGVSFSFNL